ncbi:MAG: hypothetical protein R3B84_16020 [Zavarzinella sp.]
MNKHLSPREIQRWYPGQWSDIVGNSKLVQAWHDLIKNGGTNMLVTGPSRTGKTRSISLGIMAAMCPNRSVELNPCYKCSTCEQLVNARENHYGLFSLLSGARTSYFAVDCETVTLEELKSVVRNASSEHVPTFIYLDEIAALGRRNIENYILKAIDETPAIWIASAISVLERNEKGKAKRSLGLSEPILARFAIKVGTTLPRERILANWINHRCKEWEITIDREEEIIPLLIKRSYNRVGMVIQVLAVAATRGRHITLDFVQSFNFQAED